MDMFILRVLLMMKLLIHKHTDFSSATSVRALATMAGMRGIINDMDRDIQREQPQRPHRGGCV